jgi:pimeloyl-ACP methyl ester carboxylesterase
MSRTKSTPATTTLQFETALEVRRVSANGLGFQVVLAGPAEGPLVILLHGFPEFGYAWRKQIAPLAASGFRVAVPDQRGYALSDKPPNIRDYLLDTLADDVVAIGAALGHERFSVVGHDWGGIVAWQLAAREPARIARAAILNAPHAGTLLRHALWHPMQFLRSAYVGFFQLPGVPELSLRANDHAMLAAALTHSSLPGTFTDEDLRAYRQAWSQQGALTSMLNWYRAMPAATPCRERIACPVQVIWGDKDSALDKGLAEGAATECDDARVTHVAGATHWVHHEKPELVNKLLCDFLAPLVARP